MEDTCNYLECILFDLSGGTPAQCPNYQESWWTPKGEGRPVLVKDCAPRRTFLMIQDLSNRLVATQKASEQARNNSARTEANFNKITQGFTLLGTVMNEGFNRLSGDRNKRREEVSNTSEKTITIEGPNSGTDSKPE